MRGRRARWIGLAAAMAAASAVVAGTIWMPVGRSADGPASSAAASGGPVPAGPIVFYEVLDAGGSHLVERRLNGVSPAREIAARTDVDYGRAWTVDPRGTMAIAVIPGRDDQRLEAVSVATGGSLWSARTPPAAVDHATWSADGRHVALASIGTDTSPREAIVIDAATGSFVKVVIPEDAILQGFEPGGGLILRQRLPSPQAVEVGWRFLRLDPATGAIDALVARPEVGPASDWSEDVDPAAGLAVDTTIGANDQGTAIRLWPLGGGKARVIATLPSVDRIAIDPTGAAVAISAEQTIRLVPFNGRAIDLFSGPDPIADFSWSTDGDYLAVSTDRRGPNLTIVERATGRSVELPHAGPVAQLLLVGIIGGVPLPVAALPAIEPAPSPTTPPAGPDVAAFDGLLSGWVDRSGASEVVHVQRLVPTADGGLRLVAEMPALDLGPVAVPDDGGPELYLLPRPGSRDILVWVGRGDRSSGWLWDGADGVRDLDLPPDWPDGAYDVAWRPDGRAIAASAGRAGVHHQFEAIFAIAAPSGKRTTIVPVIGRYDRLEGWWSAGELRVGHGVCADECRGRFASSARLRIRDRHLVQLTPRDRAHAPIDESVVDLENDSIVLSMINDDVADDIVIAWPAELGPAEALEVIGFAGDGRSLLVAAGTATGTDVYRVDDPVGRAVGGHLPAPGPIRILQLGARGVRLDVSPDGGWAIVTDRVDNVRLVRVSDGRSWSVERERLLVWAGAG